MLISCLLNSLKETSALPKLFGTLVKRKTAELFPAVGVGLGPIAVSKVGYPLYATFSVPRAEANKEPLVISQLTFFFALGESGFQYEYSLVISPSGYELKPSLNVTAAKVEWMNQPPMSPKIRIKRYIRSFLGSNLSISLRDGCCFLVFLVMASI